MSVNKTVLGEITKSFARYFNESDEHACSYKWLQRSNDEDNPVEAENNVSESIDVHDETAAKHDDTATKAGIATETTEEITLCAAKNTVDQLNYEGKLSNASEIMDTPTGEQKLDCNENVPAQQVDETQDVHLGDNSGNQEETIENLISGFVSSENYVTGSQKDDSHNVGQRIDSVATDPTTSNLTSPNDDSCAEIGDNEAATTVSDELSRYITLYDQHGKKHSNDEDKELEYLIGGEQALSTGEAKETGFPEAIAVDKPSECEPLLPTKSVRCCLESYDLLQDAHNPMLFHIHVKNSSLTTGRSVARRHPRSIYFEGQEIKPCFIPLKDFRIKKRIHNPLENMEFFLRRTKKAKPRTRPTQSNRRKPVKKKSTPRNRKGKFTKCNIGAKTVMAAKPPTLWDTIQEAYPKPKDETAAEPSVPTELALQQAPTDSIEEKNVSINEWLELSSQVQPDNVDVNEFLQFASLPILSDIEDDAYQLSTYLDFNDRTNHGPRNVTIAHPTQQLPQPINDAIPANSAIDLTTDPVLNFVQPMDLYTKQTTPMSTDTGFCNESFSLDIASPFHSSSVPTQDTYAYADVRNASTNGCVQGDGQAKDEFSRGKQIYDTQVKQHRTSQAPSTSWNRKPSTAQHVDTKSVLASPEVESQSEMKAPAEVGYPSEEKKIPQRVTFPPEWKVDGYSTDLDYEPSDDDDNEPEEKHSNKCHHTDNINEPLDTGLNYEPPRTENGNQIVVEVVNSKSSARVPTRKFVEKLANSKHSANTPVESLPVDTKTIGSATASLPSLPHNLARPAAEHQIGVLKIQINYLLNRPCFDYMHDESCSKLTCRYNHNLPTDHEVLNKLKLFPTETILSMYNRFIVKNRMSFVHYFPTFCKMFSVRKMKSTLLSGVWHCDRLSKMSFYRNIYRGFIGMDLPKVQALADIANVSCKSRIACTYILNIVVKEDPQFFIGMLRDYYPRANVETHHMLSLLYHLYDSPAPTLLNVFVDIFDKYSRTVNSDVEPYKMIVFEFRSLITDDLGLLRRFNAIVSRDNRMNL